ncbi:hypothetical protein [Altererythrobacter sp. GH1-8]|uniref:hypothetical protein n=1 Tax=Altererythrobacter sp. GH1-8 TaxID=3349333 RepID=UPI00374CFE63
MTIFRHSPLALTAVLLLAACAGSPNSPMDTGELITQRGDKIAGYGDAWSVGKQQVNNGERMVAESNRTLAKARKQLADARKDLAASEAKVNDAEEDRLAGEQLIAEGNLTMARAEADYSEVREGPSANSKPIDDQPF